MPCYSHWGAAPLPLPTVTRERENVARVALCQRAAREERARCPRGRSPVTGERCRKGGAKPRVPFCPLVPALLPPLAPLDSFLRADPVFAERHHS